MDFIFIFQAFFEIYFLKKSQKRVLYMRGTRKADVALCGHMAEPREPTWTHMDAYVGRRGSCAMCVWAHGYSGLTEGIGGAY